MTCTSAQSSRAAFAVAAGLTQPKSGQLAGQTRGTMLPENGNIPNTDNMDLLLFATPTMNHDRNLR